MPTNNSLYVLQFGSYGLSLQWREIYDIYMRVSLFRLFLTYLSHEGVNWVCTAGFTVFAFVRFSFGFLILWLLLLYYISLHPVLLLLFYSISLLLLSYYTMHVFCLISLTISLPAPVCLCSRHGFQYILFWFRFINTRVLILARHLAFTTPLVGEFLTLLDPHVQISELGAYGFSRLLIRDA